MKTKRELAEEALSKLKPSHHAHYNPMTEDCFREGFLAGFDAAQAQKEETTNEDDH